MKRAIQRELDSFFGDILKSDFDVRAVSKGAFSRARSKLNPSVFMHLNRAAIKAFYSTTQTLTWEGMRILAVDGTRLLLPNHQSVKDEFGVHRFGPQSNSPRSMAICSLLYDTLNKITLDAQIAPYSSSESALLDQHLGHIHSNDLLLLDRGYPSLKLIYKLSARNIHFCMRMKSNWWKGVEEFSKSEKTDTLVKFRLPKRSHNEFCEYLDILEKEITCRLIKVSIGQETIILCSSLLDTDKFPTDIFQSLYNFRWDEEEAYKVLKCRIDVEDFTGKTAIAVKQDFYAKIFMMNLCAMFAHPIDQKVRKEFKAGKNRKHGQKINWTNALSATKNILVEVFYNGLVINALKCFDSLVCQTRELIRLGRSNVRKVRPGRQFHMNYKTL